ncbi:Serine carboxypeptidase II-3 [Acorus gramineus]|uniref:Serine carboxypeptidase II-3 n=1 Tax=Acorus gramineus TaxID=55184 RepID=A0AAV9AIM4_ACOGR|nr:Serine carboxypeptidase II-3 [Acorus gramineus]
MRRSSSSSFKAFPSLLCLLLLLLLVGPARARVPAVEFVNKMMVEGLSKDWDMTASVAEPLVVPQTGSKESDLIVGGLPGQRAKGVQYTQYAGYVTVDATAGRALFYYFVEAIHNATSRPLVLWLSSGPGCSSLGDQALMGHGPYRVSKNGQTLHGNKDSLVQVANVIYLESTTGTGFSYSNTSSDYKGLSDRKISEDNFRFLVNWLERFPEYKERMFFVGGEGYGGSYAAQLMQLILNHNDASGHTNIAFTGILVDSLYECSEQNVAEYLNTPEVQKALHVNPATIPQGWRQCNEYSFHKP